MGCGCPDKETDALIIAEIERRKQSKAKQVDLEFITFSGDLWQLQKMNVKQDQIKTIKQIRAGEWEVIYERQGIK